MKTYRTAVIREPYVRWCEGDKVGVSYNPYFTLLDWQGIYLKG